MMMLRLRMLGAVGIEGASPDTAGGKLQRRPLALLAVLAAAGERGISRDKLLAFFWPESDDERARNVLRQLLHSVRRDTGLPELIVGTTELRLNTTLVGSDVADFVRHGDAGNLTAAVAVYGGPFLDGFYLSNAPAFESWKEGERARLSQRFTAVAERLAREATVLGEHERAVELWRRLAAAEPFNSRVAAELVRALGAMGDIGGALAHARVHNAMLRDELDAAPPREFEAAVEALRVSSEDRPKVAARGTTTPHPDPSALVATSGVPGGLSGDRGAGLATEVVRAGPEAHGPRLGVPLRRRRRIAVPLLLLVVGASLVASWRARWAVEPQTAPSLDARNIAVLPFEDNTPDGSFGWLANGLATDLIDALSGAAALSVRSPEAVRPFRGRPVPLDSLGRLLRVGTVVSGSIDLIEDSLRIAVRIADTRTGANAGPPIRVTGTLETIERMRLGVVDSIAAALRMAVGNYLVVTRRRAEAGSAEAWELVQRADETRLDALERAGRGELNGAIARLVMADSQLVRAGELAPRWAEPSVLRGWIAEARAGLAAEQPSDRCTAPCIAWRRAGIAAASRALERDDASVAALELRGTLYSLLLLADVDSAVASRALALAERDLRRTLSMDSSRARAWLSLGRVYRARGDDLRAHAATARAARTDPWLKEARDAMQSQMIDALQRGEAAQASTLCAIGSRTYRRDRVFVECRLYVLGWLGSTPAAADSAVREFTRVESMLDPPLPDFTRGYRRAMLGAVLARTGRGHEARRTLDRAEQEIPASDPNWPFQRAYVEVLLADTNAALQLLERYARDQPQNRRRIAASSWFAPLRGHPRFEALIHGVR